MIKCEHAISTAEKLVAFAFEASNEKDLKTLDLLREALETREGVRVAFITSSRLVAHFKGLDDMHFETTNE